jgi:hypothetical protein
MEQAFELNDKLEMLGIYRKMNFYPLENEKIGHGFENIDNHFGRENMCIQLEFLKYCFLCVEKK